MTDFNMPPGVSARDIPGQDDETGSPHPITDQWAGLAKLMAPNAVVVGAALARSLESALAAANDEITRLRVDVEALREDAAKCRAELLAIHEIASCGWSNVLQHPIAPADTLTVRDVKIMAIELLKGHQTAEPRVHG